MFHGNFKTRSRSFRAWFYRRLPMGFSGWRLKRRAGYERRWGLEVAGFTKENFFRILQDRLLSKFNKGECLELVAGDGLVGSLGLWLERSGGWSVEAWEHRPFVLMQLQRNRPNSRIQNGRLTNWRNQRLNSLPLVVTTRGAREASGVCRAIQRGIIRPALVGIWNQSRKGIWESRLQKCGYQLEAVWHGIELYRPGNR